MRWENDYKWCVANIWNEAAVVYLNYYADICLQKLRTSCKCSVRIPGDQDGIVGGRPGAYRYLECSKILSKLHSFVVLRHRDNFHTCNFKHLAMFIQNFLKHKGMTTTPYTRMIDLLPPVGLSGYLTTFLNYTGYLASNGGIIAHDQFGSTIPALTLRS